MYSGNSICMFFYSSFFSWFLKFLKIFRALRIRTPTFTPVPSLAIIVTLPDLEFLLRFVLFLINSILSKLYHRYICRVVVYLCFWVLWIYTSWISEYLVLNFEEWLAPAVPAFIPLPPGFAFCKIDIWW